MHNWYQNHPNRLVHAQGVHDQASYHHCHNHSAYDTKLSQFHVTVKFQVVLSYKYIYIYIHISVQTKTTNPNTPWYASVTVGITFR